MWHHLRARIDNVRLRVLLPNIQEHQTVDILRGLPEGSRLSPTLFGIFVADLIHASELQTQFPHDVKKLQTSLNLSLARAFHVYGDHTALLADTGVPPLSLVQYTHLAQLHFWLTKTHPCCYFIQKFYQVTSPQQPPPTPPPSTTTFRTHFTNSTLTPSWTLSHT